jgi:membrane protein implicated in regulation of membrane protease activity
MNVANSIFLICLLVGGGMLLVSVVVGDLLGGVLDALHAGVDVAGVGLMPLVLGFISMFGVGGLFSTQVFHLDPGPATLVGIGTGGAGALFVFLLFSMLARGQGEQPFSLNDLVGQTARVSVGIPPGHFGTVQLSYAGQSHELTATADVAIPAGASVKIEAVAGANVVVAPLRAAGAGGGPT